MVKQQKKQTSDEIFSEPKEDNFSLLMELIWKQREGVFVQYLLNLLGHGKFIASTEMSMSPATIYHILNEIIINQRSSIIEFGSGNSTIYIAALLCKFNLKAKLYSVDDDNDWIENIKQSFVLYEINGANVEFIHAPIKKTTQFVSNLSTFFKWYDPTVLQKKIRNKKFDMVIVDGPKGSLCPFSRFPAVPFLLDHLADSYSLFLDDTNRMQENKIFNEWSILLNEDSSLVKQKYGSITKNTKYYSYPK
ncbi:MAG: class I SAM-dependent methyltransferase [Ginsengibacter sp.]